MIVLILLTINIVIKSLLFKRELSNIVIIVFIIEKI